MSDSRDRLVVVVTGASSGIGRATAQAFARRGAAVVLAARRAEMLEDAARECVELGGAALAVPTDTTREDQVEELGRRALERFGRIDVWFNNAGVGIFGRFEDCRPTRGTGSSRPTSSATSMAPRSPCASSVARVAACLSRTPRSSGVPPNRT